MRSPLPLSAFVLALTLPVAVPADMASAQMLAASMLSAPVQTTGATAASTQPGPSQDDLQHALKGKRFDAVYTMVDGNTVTLTGSVDLLADKDDAQKRVHKVRGVSDVQNNIVVQAGEISDADLLNKLGKAITYDRVGYGTTIFNAIGVQVHDGVVRLSGEAYGPPDKDSAVSLVENTRGVRGLIDDIELEPLSPNDDRIRRAAAQAIYGYGIFQKYQINPAKPIRIIVINGNITLQGVVDSESDRNIVNLRARGVAGAFSVKDDLQVAGQTHE